MDKIGTEALKLLQENLGTVIAVLICIIGFMAWYIHKTYMRLLDGKDKEINRLYDDNQRLQRALIPELKKERKK